jgi:hypothetical protein
MRTAKAGAREKNMFDCPEDHASDCRVRSGVSTECDCGLEDRLTDLLSVFTDDNEGV